jgi:hypothetical protein
MRSAVGWYRHHKGSLRGNAWDPVAQRGTKKSFSALRLRTLKTGAIVGGSIFALLVRRHVWLESWAKTFYSESRCMFQIAQRW